MEKRKPSLLILDNEDDFLALCGIQFKIDFDLKTCNNLDEGVELLKRGWFPMVLFDKRWGNERERDSQGLIAAKKTPPQVVCCLITGFKESETDVDALNQKKIAYVFYKEAGHELFFEEIRQFYKEHVSIKWDLTIIDKGYALNLQHIWSAIDQAEPWEEGRKPDEANRKTETLDLMGMIFSEFEQVEIVKCLWRKPECVAFAVKAFCDDGAEMNAVLILGANEYIKKEKQGFEIVKGSLGIQNIVFHKEGETTHLGGRLYRIPLPGAINGLQPLHDALHPQGQEQWRTIFQKFFSDTLPCVPPSDTDQDMGKTYIQQMGFPNEAGAHPQKLNEIFKHLCKQLNAAGLILTRADGVMSLTIRGQETFEFPDPVNGLSGGVSFNLPMQAAMGVNLRNLDSILCNPNGSIWLTDFHEAKRLPPIWTPTELEATLRYDYPAKWADSYDLAQYQQLELALENSFYQPHGKEDACEFEFINGKVDGLLCQIARAVWIVREQFCTVIEIQEYKKALFFQAIRRLYEVNQAERMTGEGRLRFGHLLISLAILGKEVIKKKPEAIALETPQRVFTLSENGQEVLYRGKSIHLGAKHKAILTYFIEHGERLYGFDELVTQFVYNGIKSDGTIDDNDKQVIHTSISRLWKNKSGPEWKNYIQNDRGNGYRFSNPEIKMP